MTSPLYSVIVPCFNAQRTIATTIQSIVNQTEKDFQLVFVSDGSTDHSVDIVKEFSNSDTRIQIVELPRNCGVADTKNIGLGHSQGTFVGFVDSDDWISPNFFENLIDIATASDVDFVRSDHVRVTQYERTINQAPHSNRRSVLVPKTCIGPSSKKTLLDYPYAGTGIYKSRTLKDLDIKFQSGLRSAEDRIFFLRLLYETNSLRVSSECGYFYRKESNQTLTSTGSATQLDIFKAIEAMIKYCNDKVQEDPIFEKVFMMSLALIHHHYVFRTRLDSQGQKSLLQKAKSISPFFEHDQAKSAISKMHGKRKSDLAKIMNI